MFKTVTFVFHMLIISTNACTDEVKFKAVIRDFFAKKQSIFSVQKRCVRSHTPFLN